MVTIEITAETGEEVATELGSLAAALGCGHQVADEEAVKDAVVSCLAELKEHGVFDVPKSWTTRGTCEAPR